MADLILVLMLALAALRGWQRGFVVRALQLVGLIGAGALAYFLLPIPMAHVSSLARPSLARSIVLIIGVWLAAVAGETLMSILGRRIMAAGAHTIRKGDAVAGAIASMLVTTVLTWFVVTAVRPALPPALARQVSQSRILTTTDRVMPELPRHWAASLANSINTSRFPDVFSGLSPEPNPAVPSPNAGSASTQGVKNAAASIVKVLANSRSCGGSEGSGWVVAPHRIVTNAHVVAGSTAVVVQPGGTGPYLPATVVAFDPEVDIAILSVPGLKAAPLQRAAQLKNGESAAVAGYPLDGGYRVVAARVRDEIRATGRDIYSTGLVTRDVYSLYAVVQPGNSGGPLLTTSGQVAGTIFARSTTSTNTGYALTDSTTNKLLDEAARLSTPTSTRGCVVD